MKKAALIFALLGILMLSALSAKDKDALQQIVINPNPMTQFTEIYLTFSQQVSINVTIQSEALQVVKTLYTGPAKEYMSLKWDRLGDDGSYTPCGEYYLIVTEGRYTSTKKTLILK